MPPSEVLGARPVRGTVLIRPFKRTQNPVAKPTHEVAVPLRKPRVVTHLRGGLRRVRIVTHGRAASRCEMQSPRNRGD